MRCLWASTGLGIQGPTLHPSTRPPATALRKPRRRGDHQIECQTPGVARGPPPHTRGPHPQPRQRGGPAGTTPARAGTTHRIKPGQIYRRDHPRARGPLLVPPACVRLEGTTPACAGTTTCTSTCPAPCRDHPRMRGDHPLGVLGGRELAGPPPHARGPPGWTGPRARFRETTPACAGTTRPPARRTCWRRDHPRMRGDHLGGEAGVMADWGPPPHARGPRPQPTPRRAGPGTTPARAGTTPAASPR